MAAADLQKRYKELEKLVSNVDFTLQNNNELLEMQSDLVSDLQDVLNAKQLNMDELRNLRDQTQRISTLLVKKVKEEREQKKGKDNGKKK